MEENTVAKAEKPSYSLYPSHTEKISSYAKNNNFRSDSAALQYIIDEFFKQKNKIMGIFMLYIGYPLIIVSLMLFVYLMTHNVNEILIGKDFYFNELYILDQVFLIMGMGALGITIPLIYIFKKKYAERK